MQSRHSNLHDEPLASAHLDAAVDADEGDLLLRVTGHLPAADFQPAIIAAARRFHVRGWIQAEAGGALIRAVATESQLVKLVRAMLREPPTSTSIRSVDTELVGPSTPPVGERFVALVAEALPLPAPAPVTPLAHVA